MEDIYESLLFYDDLSPKRREQVRARLDDEPELADALQQWRQVRARIREQFHSSLPDRRLLVLYALDAQGHTDLLSDDERDALDAARDDIEAALDAHPALEDVVSHIQEEQTAFDAAWAEADAVVETPSKDGAPSPDSAIDRTSGARTDREPRASDARDTSRRRFLRIATAAMTVALAAIVWFIWPQETSMTTISVAEGETRQVQLVDGSTVRLAGESELVFNNVTSQAFSRTVTLNYGRAFFNVQSQKSGTPFVVHTPTARTVVTGTKFAVVSDPGRTDVTLTEGEVRVGQAGNRSTADEVTLAPGQRSRVEDGAVPTPPEAVELSTSLEWTGLFIYRSTSTFVIAQQLSDHYGVDVTVADALEGEAVTGTFDRDQPVTQVLNAIAATLGARVEGSAEDGFRLTPR